MEEEKLSNEMENEENTTSTETGKLTNSLQWNHVIPLPIRTIGGIRDQTLKRKHCTCKKSGCLKLYCDCFNSGIFCSVTCKCLECKNQEFRGQFEKDFRTETIMAILDRNENAFRTKAQNLKSSETSLVAQGLVAANASLETTETTVKSSFDRFEYKTKKSKDGCNCKKSACLKKYCECFQATLYCTGDCRCSNCENVIDNDKREKLVAKLKKKGDKKDTDKVPSEASRCAERNEITEKVSVGGIPANIVSLLSKGLAAAGVDEFVPPGNYARPLLLPNGRVINEVGFGTISTSTIGATDKTDSNRGKDNQKRSHSDVTINVQHDFANVLQIYKDQMKKVIQNSNDTILEACQISNPTGDTLNLNSMTTSMSDMNDAEEGSCLKQRYSELAEKSVATVVHELNNIQKQMNLQYFSFDQGNIALADFAADGSIPDERNVEATAIDKTQNLYSDKVEKEAKDIYEIASRRKFIYDQLTRIIQEKTQHLIHKKRKT